MRSRHPAAVAAIVALTACASDIADPAVTASGGVATVVSGLALSAPRRHLCHGCGWGERAPADHVASARVPTRLVSGWLTHGVYQ